MKKILTLLLFTLLLSCKRVPAQKAKASQTDEKQELSGAKKFFAEMEEKALSEAFRGIETENGKELMLVHFDPNNVFKPMVKGEVRYDQEMVNYIKENGYRYFDMNEVHLEDFRKFNISLDEYMDRYFVGHYNPSGNHFFAYSMKDTIVDWLDPKPITYQQKDSKLIRFKGYLQE